MLRDDGFIAGQSLALSDLLEQAAGESIMEVLLLTSTARELFSKRFGFTEANRADYDERLAGSPEWGLPSLFFRRPDDTQD
jgi:N-acetylglutamate synthase-like GNAT family acetyltransferase